MEDIGWANFLNAKCWQLGGGGYIYGEREGEGEVEEERDRERGYEEGIGSCNYGV